METFNWEEVCSLAIYLNSTSKVILNVRLAFYCTFVARLWYNVLQFIVKYCNFFWFVCVSVDRDWNKKF